ncbi:hypothetical protein D3C72_1813740 [compost metagenome]
MHGVGKYRHHAVGPRRHARRHLFQQAVGIDTQPFRQQLLFGTEGVAEPAHGQPGEETYRLRLCHAGDHVWVDANVHLRIGGRFRQIDDLLPEGAAQHGCLPGMHHPQPQAAQLHIAAAHHDRCAAQ